MHLSEVTRDLVIANRILASEGVVDGYGHVSVRHPEHPEAFLISRSLGPQYVTADDIMECDALGRPLSDSRPPYLERFIHAGIYEARPEVHAVVHAHTEAVLPYTISEAPLQAVVHDASDIGSRIARWDIRDEFGDATDMLVSSVEMGRSLARALGGDRTVLMRGHGFALAGTSLLMTVRAAIYLGRNASVQTIAQSLGPIVALSEGEIAARAAYDPASPAMQRGWRAWAERAGCGDLLPDESPCAAQHAHQTTSEGVQR
jgi:HCOMODA/2-hydroxy-3-carboxy-muconic semialdehyde decarboxylase